MYFPKQHYEIFKEVHKYAAKLAVVAGPGWEPCDSLYVIGLWY